MGGKKNLKEIPFNSFKRNTLSENLLSKKIKRLQDRIRADNLKKIEKHQRKQKKLEERMKDLEEEINIIKEEWRQEEKEMEKIKEKEEIQMRQIINYYDDEKNANNSIFNEEIDLGEGIKMNIRKRKKTE